MPATLTIWLQLLGLLATETAVIIALCAQVSRLTRSAIWRRTIWQACVVALALLAVVELTGTARGLFGWTKGNREARTGAANFRSDGTAIDLRNLTAPLPARSSQGEGEKLTTSVSAPPHSAFPNPARPDPMAVAAGALLDPAHQASGAVPRTQEPANNPLPLLCLRLAWMTGAGVVPGALL